jgi:hypothetical protein
MAYIGKQPVVGNFVKLDAITTSATATYNLLNGGVAYFPQTANNCIVSLNGVIQSPTSAYTISGSTIVFDSALTSSDSIDFILVLGDVLSIGTPSDNTVSTSKLVDANVTTAKIADGNITPVKLSDLANPFAKELLHVRDEKAANTDGGTFTSGSFQTRTLNTSMTNEISGASLSSNQITLPSGTYYIIAQAPAFKTDFHKLKLRNTTDSTDTLIGSSEYCQAIDNVGNKAFLNGRFTIAAQKVFELQHRCSATKTDNGFGNLTNFGVTEVFADVQIWKVA